MTRLIGNSLNHLLDIVVPRLCIACGTFTKGQTPFCPQCEAKIKLILPPYCPICGKPLPKGNQPHICGSCLQEIPFFDKARSVFYYQNSIREAIIKFKFAESLSLTDFWVKSILKHLNSFIEQISPDLICPVPLHITRLRQRGYNQSWLIAKKLGKNIGIKSRARVLMKRKVTLDQVGLSMAKRKLNVRNSFEVNPKEKVAKKCILLIDDVFTSGSTVNECARILKKSGAKRVYVITLARAISEI